jgi:hypothetical protein
MIIQIQDGVGLMLEVLEVQAVLEVQEAVTEVLEVLTEKVLAVKDVVEILTGVVVYVAELQTIQHIQNLVQ